MDFLMLDMSNDQSEVMNFAAMVEIGDRASYSKAA